MSTTNKNSILVIDDEVSNLRLLTHMLGNEYTVHVATDGSTGIEIAQEHKPDLILLDIVMPEMDGYEVYSKLSESDKTRNIPVIIITGLNASVDKVKEQGMEVIDYISKPFNAETVKTRIRNHINKINTGSSGS